MSDKIKLGFMILFFCMFGSSIFFITGCMTAPDRSDYNYTICYAADRCFYKKYKDCQQLVEECVNTHKENRYNKRHLFCKEKNNRAIDDNYKQTYNECMLSHIPKSTN